LYVLTRFLETTIPGQDKISKNFFHFYFRIIQQLSNHVTEGFSSKHVVGYVWNQLVCKSSRWLASNMWCICFACV